MSIIALIFVASCCLLALFVPWIGVLAYYLFSVMQMQEFWPYEFGDGRVQIYIIGATILGLAGATAMKSVDWNRLLTPFSLIVILLVFLVNLSVYFSTFEFYIDPLADPDASKISKEQVLEVFNKTLIFYFIASLLIDTRTKLLCSIYLLAGIVLFYALWANKVYFTGEFWLFGDNGRLGGPIRSTYRDENYFAMLFVLATPVLYYLGVARQNWFIRYSIWFLIPITWHALFLTSSRGAMLSLAVVCIYVFFRSFDRKASIGMAVGLVLAVATQSGELLKRVDNTVDAAQQLEVVEKKLDPRLISWEIATILMREYPVFGVGVGNFVNAFPNYSDTKPHVAHNTFFQFAANCGIAAGLIYLWLFAMRLPTLRRSADINGTRNFPRGFDRDYVDDLLNSVFLGFFMISMFLDLMIYEIMYFLLTMSFCKYNLDRADPPVKHRMIDSIYLRVNKTKTAS